ncbi:hypothetical protein AAG570_010571 [Ranatra chinensis]|uniref:Elongation of very long chain fatty acids protein n=1 Tax=Ranatra chinensis TaxID=642074 RepID=A0ABD0YQ30_9HEMI
MVMLFADDMVNSLLLVNSPWTVTAIIAAYLAFVTKIGPELMRHHKPFNLKPIMVAYNVAQVLYNMWLIYLVFLVLRKKNSHISVLHLFHHTTMVISVWVSLKYIRGIINFILAILREIKSLNIFLLRHLYRKEVS